MNKQNLDKKTIAILLMFILQLTTMVSINQGWITPEQGTLLQDMTREQIQNYLEIEVNSSFYKLQKQCSWLIQKVSSYTCMFNGSNFWYSTNASAVFNACNGNLTTGGSIFFKGTHTLTNSFLVNDNIEVYGEGITSRLLLDAGKVCPVITNADTTNGNANITLSSFYINGNEGNVGGSPNYLTSGVYFARVNDSKIENMFIENCWADCIRWEAGSFRNIVTRNILQDARFGVFFNGDGYADDPSFITISNNFVKDAHGTPGTHGNGIFVREGTFIVIEGNDVSECIDTGCEVRDCNYTTISTNVFYDNCKGILVRESYHVTVDSNSIYDTVFGSATYGIWVLGTTNTLLCREITLSNNNIYYTNSSGIRIENAMRVTADGNTIDTNFESGVDAIRVYLTVNAHVENGGLIFTNNIIRNAQGYGIYIATAATYVVRGCVVSGNVITECGEDGIRFGRVEYSVCNTNVCHNNGGYGISAGASDYNNYIGNNCYSNTNGDAVNGEGANSKVAHNIGDADHDT